MAVYTSRDHLINTYNRWRRIQTIRFVPYVFTVIVSTAWCVFVIKGLDLLNNALYKSWQQLALFLMMLAGLFAIGVGWKVYRHWALNRQQPVICSGCHRNIEGDQLLRTAYNGKCPMCEHQMIDDPYIKLKNKPADFFKFCAEVHKSQRPAI